MKDPRTRFDLALDCGNMEIATDMAKSIDLDDCWIELANTSLKQGNVEVSEIASQRLKDLEQLSFVYILTGAEEKLRKMNKIFQSRKDSMSEFHGSLFLGDVEEQIRILSDSGLCSNFQISFNFQINLRMSRL